MMVGSTCCLPSKKVTFAPADQLMSSIFEVPVFPQEERTALLPAALAAGKLASRDHRSRFPALPKFTYYDDEKTARAATAAAEAVAKQAAAQSTISCFNTSSIMIQPSNRRSSRRSSRGEYCLLSPSRESIVAAAVAAATAAISAGWDIRQSPDYRDPSRNGAAMLAAVATIAQQHSVWARSSAGSALLNRSSTADAEAPHVSSPLRPSDAEPVPRQPRLPMRGWLRARWGRDHEHRPDLKTATAQTAAHDKPIDVIENKPDIAYIQRRDSVQDAIMRHIRQHPSQMRSLA